MNILLSILTPAVPSRLRQLDWLCDKIQRQIGNLPVEHLVLLDNKRRTVGEKRDALLRAAKGEYIAFVDDDDDISDDYVHELVNVIARALDQQGLDHHSQAPTHRDPAPSRIPDVITFLQKATVNDQTALIEFKLGNPNDPFIGVLENQATGPRDGGRPIVKRNAWHICAWRRQLAIGSAFPAINYGEDWQFAAPLCAIAQSSHHIDKILHYYRHDQTKTEAPHPSSAIPAEVEGSRTPQYGDAGALYKPNRRTGH